MNSPLRCRHLAGLPILAVASITVAAEDREDFLERVADDLAFAERALHTTLSTFRDQVSYYLKQKINSALDEKLKHHLEPPVSRGRGHSSYIYDQTAKKLRRLTLSERREYLDTLRLSLVEEYKESRHPDSHRFFIRRLLNAMEERDIIFSEQRSVKPDVTFNEKGSIE